MKDKQEAMDSSARVADDVISGGSTAATPDADRAFLLECRLDQLHSALQGARAEADLCRTRLAEAAAREADHARRQVLLHEELAAAREEVAALHRRLEHAEALQAELEGRLFESGARDEAGELVRLRREMLAERQQTVVHERTVTELRARVEELTATRETLLTRVAEWQSLVRQGDPDAVDLSEFIASLRGDILALEHQNVMGEHREADLREQLERAGVAAERTERDEGAHDEAAKSGEATAHASTDVPEGTTSEGSAAAPESERANVLVEALAAAGGPESQIELLLRLGRSREDGAFYAIRRWATSTEPRVRAAAFEALGRLLERDPSRLEHHLRWGLADPDPRVRRRVVLAAAAAQGLALRPLLEPLRGDPDPQVRRVVQEVLRGTLTGRPAVDDGAPGTYAPRVVVGSISGGVPVRPGRSPGRAPAGSP